APRTNCTRGRNSALPPPPAASARDGLRGQDLARGRFQERHLGAGGGRHEGRGAVERHDLRREGTRPARRPPDRAAAAVAVLVPPRAEDRASRRDRACGDRWSAG
ncbi:hypothetical protein THAOC_20499, partial [Thalassiosira oceanica]